MPVKDARLPVPAGAAELGVSTLSLLFNLHPPAEFQKYSLPEPLFTMQNRLHDTHSYGLHTSPGPITSFPHLLLQSKNSSQFPVWKRPLIMRANASPQLSTQTANALGFPISAPLHWSEGPEPNKL